MRRKDKEVVDQEFMNSVISRSPVCRIGLCEDGITYIVPMCFGYDDGYLYLHSAQEGRKIDILKKNPEVSFEFDIDCELKSGDKPCSFSMKYRSVMGTGQASFVEDADAKHTALGIIMRHYSQGAYTFPEASLGNIAVIKIAIREMTGKKSGY